MDIGTAMVFGLAFVVFVVMGVIYAFATRCPKCRGFFVIKQSGFMRGSYHKRKWQTECKKCGHQEMHTSGLR